MLEAAAATSAQTSFSCMVLAAILTGLGVMVSATNSSGRVGSLRMSPALRSIHWAMTQNNLGIAFRVLGERESGTRRLEQAVTAFRAASQERTRERVPRLHEETQQNFAIVFEIMERRKNEADS
jgi:hypothetical protein